MCRTGGVGSSNLDSQSDSFSEYLAAAEAERLDRQLAAEAEEEEAKLDAEALSRAGSGDNGKGKGTGRYFAAKSVLAGVVSAGEGRGKGGRRRRLVEGGKGGGWAGSQQQQQQQPRIIFKEQWREKELRVWQEAGGAGGFFPHRAGVRAEGSGGSGKDLAGRGSSPPKGWKLLPIIVKV